MPGEDTAVAEEVDNGGLPEEPLESFYNAPVEPEEPAESEPEETTDSVKSPFEGKPLEEVAQDPVVEQLLRDREARLAESYRQRVENEQRQAQEYWEKQAFEQRNVEAQQVRQGYAYRSLTGLVKQALDRGEEPPAAAILDIANKLSNASFHDQFNALSQFERDLVMQQIPDYRPSPAVVSQLERARQTANPQALATANLQMVYEAARTELWPHALQAAWEQMQQQNQVNGVKNAQVARQGQARPTTMGGPAVRAKTYTQDEIEHMPMKQWDSFSEKERERILATAR